MGIESGLDWRRDSPWLRLPVTLPGAVLIGLLGVWSGGMLMPGPLQPPLETPALDAQFIELPPPPPPAREDKPEREPPPLRDEPQAETAAEAPPTPASLAAPPAPSAEEWQVASTYTLKNSKRYRNAWGQQVRSQMGTAVAGPDQGQVRFRITINPDGSLAQAEELWSTSAKASELARKAIQSMPPLPPTPGGKPLVFEKTISFLPYETGWPPSYKNDCLPEPPTFKNPFAWSGQGHPSPQPSQPEGAEPAVAAAENAECDPTSTASSIEEEEQELARQIDQNRWGH
jgi:TonB family protein